VGAALVGELQPVLDGAQQAVGLGERVGVLVGDVAVAARASSAGSVPVARSDRSPRPWTSCSSWTANSMSRMPPGAELELPFAVADDLGLGLDPPFIARISATTSGRAGRATRTARRPRAARAERRSPATGRALSSAWNSQVLAHRSQ
jgi:hypothetical protein